MKEYEIEFGVEGTAHFAKGEDFAKFAHKHSKNIVDESIVSRYYEDAENFEEAVKVRYTDTCYIKAESEAEALRAAPEYLKQHWNDVQAHFEGLGVENIKPVAHDDGRMFRVVWSYDMDKLFAFHDKRQAQEQAWQKAAADRQKPASGKSQVERD